MRLKPWKMKPISSRRTLHELAAAQRVDAAAVQPHLAAVGASRHPAMCMNVDLPEPDGPMIAAISPRVMSSVAPRSASTKLSLPSR